LETTQNSGNVLRMKYSNLILSIETSSNTCGIALSSNGDVISEYSYFAKNNHDKLLAEYFSRTLIDSEIQITDLDAIALSTGPGSFTGIRIGSAFVKGLLFGSKVKFIAVPTLESLQSASLEFAKSLQKDVIASYIKSHKDLYFYQEFNLSTLIRTEIEIIEENNLKERLSKDVIYAGNYNLNFEQLKTLSGLQKLTPRFVAKRAYEKFTQNEFDDIESYTPLYQLDFTPKTKVF